MIEFYNINEKGPLKKVADRYLQRQLDKEKELLKKNLTLSNENKTVLFLAQIKDNLGVIMKQNHAIISYLERLTNGPSGDVHYIKLIEYDKDFGEVFIDFVRGEKNSKTRLPANTEYTFPYTHVYMIKIVNDGPANISFQTNRHARMIDLHAGESDIISENENFQLTELRLSNATNNNANVRIVVYA